MPNAAEAFLVVLIAAVVLAATRLPRLGDSLGAVLRGLMGRSPSSSDD